MTQSFLLDKVKPGDALISTDYGRLVTFEGNNKFSDVYFYNIEVNNPGEYVLSIVSNNNSGWIVLDDQIYDGTKPLPLKTIFVGNKEIEYMGEVANEYIWRWGVE